MGSLVIFLKATLQIEYNKIL